AHGIDEADLPHAVLKGVVPRRRAGAVGLESHERLPGMDDLADLVAREHLLGPPGTIGVEWHVLDETDYVRLLPRKLREGDDLFFREIPHRHRIDLDRPNAWVALNFLESF